LIASIQEGLMPMRPEEEEARWEEAAGMRDRSPHATGLVASPQERNWAVAAHLSGFLKYMLPVAYLAAPLAIWLFQRDVSTYVDDHALEALNFQISMTIYTAIGLILTWLLVGYVVLAGLIVLDTVAAVVAALRASRGEDYRYPFSLRLVS
jgi:uncharacterized Tic20 family protein